MSSSFLTYTPAFSKTGKSLVMMTKSHSTVSAVTPLNIPKCLCEREELPIAGNKGCVSNYLIGKEQR